MTAEKEFVPYAESLELKELGFDEPCFGLYHNDKTSYIAQCKSHEQFYEQLCSAPTLSQAFRWFRQKGYDIKVQKESKGLYFGFYWTGASWVTVGAGSYEEAELACLRKLIQIVKEKTRISTN